MNQDFAFIFDMDGVLVLSSKIHGQAFHKALETEEVKLDSYSFIAGMRTDTAFKLLYQKSQVELSEDKLTKLVDLKRRTAQKLLKENFPLAPGVPEVLFNLQARKIKMGLASSSSSFNVNMFLKESGAESVFSVVMSGEDVLKAKPDPEIYIRSAQQLGYPIEKCVVVEDSRSGIQAAQSAGAKIVAVNWAEETQNPLEMGAHLLIKRIDDLVDIRLSSHGQLFLAESSE